jgi:hypothetical protein
MRTIQKSDIIISIWMTILALIFAVHTYTLSDNINCLVFSCLTLFGAFTSWTLCKAKK